MNDTEIPEHVPMLRRMARRRQRENWRQWVRDLRRRQETITAELEEAVILARKERASWAEIAEQLKITQQAANKRFRHLDDKAYGRDR